MSTESQQFSLDIIDDYIYMKTWGVLDPNNVEAPANAALELAKKKHIKKLLDDISEVDSKGATIAVQTKGVGVLWKLRAFDKVAIVLSESPLRTLFFSTLNTLHLDHGLKFKGFDNKGEAVTWLRSEE